MMTPNYRTHSSVPRLARTAPVLGRIGARRFQQPHPSYITFTKEVKDGAEYCTVEKCSHAPESYRESPES